MTRAGREVAPPMASPQQQQVVERETRLTRIVLPTTVIGVLAVFIGNGMQASGVSVNDDDAEQLISRADSFSDILLGSILSGIGFLLIGGTALFLYDAARRRSDAMQSAMRPILIIGPLLLAISGVITAIGYDSVASDFVASGVTTGDAGVDRAKDLVSG